MSIDWNRVRQGYVTTTKSLHDVAGEFGVNLDYLKRKSANEGWFAEKKQYRERVHQEVTKRLLEKAVSEADSIMERCSSRAAIWRELQASFLALARGLGVIDPITGLPREGSLDEFKKMAGAYRTGL